MNLSDVYYVIFRQKWKIISLTLAGLIGAVVIYYTMPPTYMSVANLLVKYINGGNTGGSNPINQDEHPLDPGVIGILKNEELILRSFDLAMRVATNIGPEKILARYGGGSDANTAAGILRESLTVGRASEQGSVLSVMVSLADRDLVQPVLKEYVEDYKQWHIQIHEVIPQEHDVLLRKSDNIAADIKEDQSVLRLLKQAANINELTTSKSTYEMQIQQYEQNIRQAQIELDEHEALLRYLTLGTNNMALTNNAEVKASPLMNHEVPKDKVEEYARVSRVCDSLWASYLRDQEIYKADSAHQTEKMKKIKEQEDAKKKLEAEEPLLTTAKYKKTETDSTQNPSLALDRIAVEEGQVDMVKVRLNGLYHYLNEIKAQVTNMQSYEGRIVDAERKLHQDEKNYDSVQTVLNTLQMDADLSTIRNANIFVTENATPPVREQSKTPRTMAFSAIGGIAAGLAWAFAIELLLDRSVKRSKDIETDLGMRLFLTIPKFGRNGRRRARRAPKKTVREGKPGTLLPAIKEEEKNGEPGPAEIAPWDVNHPLHEYYDALRDRLMTYFEIHNLTHKPKLVAVTGSSKGSGATTIAAGLAASLSEGGVGANVLLIDMNQEQGAAHHFYNGEPSIELDDALALETKSGAKFQDHLYVVGGGNRGDKLSSMLPRKFQNLLPKLRASDYDYIIFDMPTISRTGVTQRLAGFMDMMLLVVEAERTQKEVLRQANALLLESKAKVSVVLNKTQTYVPEAIQQEF